METCGNALSTDVPEESWHEPTKNSPGPLPPTTKCGESRTLQRMQKKLVNLTKQWYGTTVIRPLKSWQNQLQVQLPPIQDSNCINCSCLAANIQAGPVHDKYHSVLTSSGVEQLSDPEDLQMPPVGQLVDMPPLVSGLIQPHTFPAAHCNDTGVSSCSPQCWHDQCWKPPNELSRHESRTSSYPEIAAQPGSCQLQW